MVENQIPQELKGLIPGYLTRRDQDIETLKSYIKTKDFAGVKWLAHKLKGNGSSFGFDKISQIGTQLTEASDSKNIQDIERLVSTLENEIVQIRTQLQ